ncbi:MAG: phosphotransferase [Steroidobacteraceae bacterium]|jgi:aminoglycoside/choline kinase family phosphotransferase|nr:phosphotransferase [Steroidobacteraceae bacterium]
MNLRPEPTPAPRAPDARLESLTRWIRAGLGRRDATVEPASADASFRRYFRVRDGGATYVAMDAPPDREDLGPFVGVARALDAIGVHVPRVLEEDRTHGFLLLTDLGSRHYLAALNGGADVDRLYADAAAALLAIQTRGQAAAAALAPYGVHLLDREVQLFPEWFLGRHLGVSPDAATRDLVERASARLAVAALEQPQVFVHRDYHSRNLMVCDDRNPGILDFQDAVRGAVTYDLVSLYKDCYVVWPRDRVLGWVRDYRERAVAAGLALPDAREFVRWFDLMGVQRHLKVLGIFARLWYRDGKSGYLHDLPTVLAYVRDAARAYGELAELARLLDEVVAPRFEAAQRRALADARA